MNILDQLNAEIERLQADLADARGEIARLRSYKQGLDRNVTELEAETERLRAAERQAIGEASKFGAERDAMRAALTAARQFINDHGPDTPGEAAGRTNDMLAMLAGVLNNEQKAKRRPDDIQDEPEWDQVGRPTPPIRG